MPSSRWSIFIVKTLLQSKVIDEIMLFAIVNWANHFSFYEYKYRLRRVDWESTLSTIDTLLICNTDLMPDLINIHLIRLYLFSSGFLDKTHETGQANAHLTQARMNKFWTT